MQTQADADERKPSTSRGRETLVATGRGGKGNIKSSTTGGRNAEENYSPTRGLELSVDGDTTKPLGRGGVGNILTQSRARAASRFSEGHPHTQAIVAGTRAKVAAYERSIIAVTSTSASGVRSSGRGGSGNISSSRPHSRTRAPSLKLFKKKKEKSRRAGARSGQTDSTVLGADGQKVDAESAPSAPGGKPAKNTSIGARARRIPAMVSFRRQRVALTSPEALPTTIAATVPTPPSLQIETSSLHTERCVSVIDIKRRASSLSYARLSGITLPPSPDLDSPSMDDNSFVLPPESPSSDTSSHVFEFETSSNHSTSSLDVDTPASSFVCGSLTPRSLSPPYNRQMFEFPAVPSSHLAPARIKLAGALSFGSRSTPSLPTLAEDVEQATSDSFLNLTLSQ